MEVQDTRAISMPDMCLITVIFQSCNQCNYSYLLQSIAQYWSKTFRTSLFLHIFIVSFTWHGCLSHLLFLFLLTSMYYPQAWSVCFQTVHLLTYKNIAMWRDDMWSVIRVVWWALRLEHCVLVNISFFIGVIDKLQTFNECLPYMQWKLDGKSSPPWPRIERASDSMWDSRLVARHWLATMLSKHV